jgi:hypothetical protein
MHCVHCYKVLINTRYNKQRKFCSRSCSAKHRIDAYIRDWLDGKVTGYIKDNFRLSGYVRNFLLEESKHKCILCGWSERNPITGLIPLHIDHINGDASNCSRNNLRVICPNCHSLTPNYGALNIGNSVRKRFGLLV